MLFWSRVVLLDLGCTHRAWRATAPTTVTLPGRCVPWGLSTRCRGCNQLTSSGTRQCCVLQVLSGHARTRD